MNTAQYVTEIMHKVAIYRNARIDQMINAWFDLEQAVRKALEQRPVVSQGPVEPLTDFKEEQWWVAELDALAVTDASTDDQKRAVAVVHNLLRTVAVTPTANAKAIRNAALEEAALHLLQLNKGGIIYDAIDALRALKSTTPPASEADTGEAAKICIAARHIRSIVDRMEYALGPSDESKELEDIAESLSAIRQGFSETDEFDKSKQDYLDSLDEDQRLRSIEYRVYESSGLAQWHNALVSKFMSDDEIQEFVEGLIRRDNLIGAHYKGFEWRDNGEGPMPISTTPSTIKAEPDKSNDAEHYKGHASLADMVRTHLGDWQSLVEECKRTGSYDALWCEHEIKAIKDIANAINIDLQAAATKEGAQP